MDTIQKHDQGYKINTFLFTLTFRSFCFFFLLLSVFVLFYISGNYQEFLDSTQHFILVLCSTISIALMLFCIAGTLESLVYFILTKKNKYVIFLIVYIFVFIVSTLLLLAVRTISSLSAGI